MTIVHEHDLVAGERQFVAASRADAVDGREKLDARLAARILNRQTRFVREFTEVHLRCMRGLTQHENIGAGAEHPVFQAGDDDRSDVWVFEANSLNGVGEFDIDAEVVRIQFQLIA
jgi:hypothetical protein